MMGACKLNPVVVNKLPQDWCGQEIPAMFEAKVIPGAVVYDINTDEVKPKRGKRKNVNSDL